MTEKATILVIEDKESMAEMLANTLASEGYRALTAPTGEKGLEKALAEQVDLVLTDLKLPGMTGIDVLKELKEKKPLLPVILMTAFGTIDTAVEAVKLGAYDFLTKPFQTSKMIVLIERAIESGHLTAENALLREEFAETLGFPRIIGKSAAITAAIELVRKAAPTKATVLLTGESGTGKELFARAIHHLSPRARGPMVAINCAALPRDLLESELFGHEKGAYTGADARKLGKFELADKGTIFLDEVGELDIALQAKLLRVLQGEGIQRVGGSLPLKTDVRVVAASNRDLEKAITAGVFREDLFYRLNVFPVRVPPLRERGGDIPLLAKHFVEVFCREMKRQSLEFTNEAMDALCGGFWKGNVRELENCIERAVILTEGAVIDAEHLSVVKVEGAVVEEACPEPVEDEQRALKDLAKEAAEGAERKAIAAVLETCGGNKTRAAEQLGVSYKTLLTKIRDYDLD